MMLDADIVAVSPSSVWRVLSRAGLLRKWRGKTSLKGTGFQQPLQPHQHWHIDVSYINISGTFYYLCSVLIDWILARGTESSKPSACQTTSSPTGHVSPRLSK